MPFFRSHNRLADKDITPAQNDFIRARPGSWYNRNDDHTIWVYDCNDDRLIRYLIDAYAIVIDSAFFQATPGDYARRQHAIAHGPKKTPAQVEIDQLNALFNQRAYEDPRE